MYSEEIKKLLEIKKNLLTLNEYNEVIKSIQVDHVKYENEEFKVWTKDNYNFSFKLKRDIK